MIDDRFDDVLKEAARDYNEPPQTPRELMWARIEAVRRERAQRRERLGLLYSPWTRWGVGIAAALVIGVGIGRYVEQMRSTAGPLATNGGAELRETDTSVAYRLAAMEHLTRAETFLTSFRSDPRLDADESGLGEATGELLSSTRLLLDSPAAEDPRFRALLEDLELVLVQIARLTDETEESETVLVNDGIERSGLLLRLRSAIPAGPAVGVEGAL